MNVRRQEIARRLRNLEDMRRGAEVLERAMQTLSPQERLVVQMLLICPEKGNVDRLCEMLHLEQSSVYRRRDRALEKLGRSLGMM